MSDKPEKIWHRECPADCGADYCDVIELVKVTDRSTEYIRADLAKPSECEIQEIYCAGNRTSNLFFQCKEDALDYQAQCGAASGVDVFSVHVIPKAKK